MLRAHSVGLAGSSTWLGWPIVGSSTVGGGATGDPSALFTPIEQISLIAYFTILSILFSGSPDSLKPGNLSTDTAVMQIPPIPPSSVLIKVRKR